jgi:hypothetical protein
MPSPLQMDPTTDIQPKANRGGALRRRADIPTPNAKRVQRGPGSGIPALHHLHRIDFSDIGVHPEKARIAVIQDDRAVATSLSNLDRGCPATNFRATKLALFRSLKELPL